MIPLFPYARVGATLAAAGGLGMALFASRAAFAQSAPAAAATSAAAAAPSVFPTLLALALVIAAIVIFGWIMKKFSPGAAQSGKLLRAVSQLSVGPKERVVVVEFQSQWLVLGVTAAGVSLLTQAAAPTEGTNETETPKANLPFSSWLQQTLAGRKP